MYWVAGDHVYVECNEILDENLLRTLYLMDVGKVKESESSIVFVCFQYPPKIFFYYTTSILPLRGTKKILIKYYIAFYVNSIDYTNYRSGSLNTIRLPTPGT